MMAWKMCNDRFSVARSVTASMETGILIRNMTPCMAVFFRIFHNFKRIYLLIHTYISSVNLLLVEIPVVYI